MRDQPASHEAGYQRPALPVEDIALAAQISPAAQGARLRIYADGAAAGVHALRREHAAAGAQRILHGDSDAALDVELRRVRWGDCRRNCAGGSC